jgi:DNA-binding SARP family transcriptional activator
MGGPGETDDQEKGAKMPQFNVLGNLEIIQDGRSITPSPPKVRRVLALLVMRANQVVHPDSLIAELWGQAPPKSAITTLQTYVYHLRKMFAEEGVDDSGRELLVTRPPGYTLQVSRNMLDTEVFERLTREGREHLEQGHPARAAPMLREALRLWTGPALANVSLGSQLEAQAVALEEQRIHALQLRIQADMEMGRHRELIGELRLLAAENPLNEWFSSRLITALAHSGRRSEALHEYQKVRAVLRSELGLDPSAELQRVQRDVLTPVASGGAVAAAMGSSDRRSLEIL